MMMVTCTSIGGRVVAFICERVFKLKGPLKKLPLMQQAAVFVLLVAVAVT